MFAQFSLKTVIKSYVIGIHQTLINIRLRTVILIVKNDRINLK